MTIKAPYPTEVKNISYPEVPRVRLDNGLTVLCVEDRHLPRVSVMAAFPVGRAWDPPQTRGLGQLAVEMLKEGTSSRGSREIAETLDRLAIESGLDVGLESSTISFTQLEGNVEAALALGSEMVLSPAFPEEELTKAKLRWQSHLIAQRSDPSFLATERLLDYCYPSHPYSFYSIPIQHLDQIQPDNLGAFFRKTFTPAECFLLFAGSIDLVKAGELGEEFFGEWQTEAPVSPVFPDLDPLQGPRVLLVDRPGSVQSKFLVGVRSLSRLSREFPVLKLANQVFGGGASSRLFLNLREDKGYTYGAYSSLRSHKHAGLLSAGASVRTDVTLDALRETLGEMRRMKDQPPSEDELKRAKSELIGSFIRRLETPQSIGALETSRMILGLPEDYYSDYIPAIDSISVEEVVEIAGRILDQRQTIIVVVGDAASVKDGLSDLGPVEIYDVEGNRKD